jgi:outer membrane protein OmpA-like peptidoglycan-associated protein
MFDFDKAVLTAKGSRWVKAVAHALPASAIRAIHCQGNTDSVGSAQYNYTLGMRRADAVCKAFKRRIKARFHSSSAGEYKARASNSTDKGRARNRRVVLGLFYR